MNDQALCCWCEKLTDATYIINDHRDFIFCPEHHRLFNESNWELLLCTSSKLSFHTLISMRDHLKTNNTPVLIHTSYLESDDGTEIISVMHFWTRSKDQKLILASVNNC